MRQSMASDTYAQRLDSHCKTSWISTSKRTQVLKMVLPDYMSFMNRQFTHTFEVSQMQRRCIQRVLAVVIASLQLGCRDQAAIKLNGRIRMMPHWYHEWQKKSRTLGVDIAVRHFETKSDVRLHVCYIAQSVICTERNCMNLFILINIAFILF